MRGLLKVYQKMMKKYVLTTVSYMNIVFFSYRTYVRGLLKVYQKMMKKYMLTTVSYINIVLSVIEPM